MSTDVVMPQMGESITEGTITRWLKQVGEKVERDEMIFEISTDKVDAEIPSPIAGTLTEIRVKEGETVEVGTIVAVVGDGNGAQAPAPQPAAAPPPPPPPPAQPTVAVAAPPPPPQQPSVASSQTIAPSSPAGSETVAASDYSGASSPSEQKAASAEEAPGTDEQTIEDLRRTRSSPLVRKIAEEHNIDISRLEGTGASGRVTKNDILSFIESGAPASPQPPTQQQTVTPQQPAVPAQTPLPPMQAPPAPTLPPGEGDRVEAMSVMRRKIAEHMITSQRTSAHVATVYEIDMTRVAALRDKNKAQFQQATGTKLTFMPFIFQAVTSAIRQFPIFNAQVSGDQIIYKRDINLGMAVALDWGLIVPVIKRADELSLSGLARAANDLTDRARAKQLKPDEVAGGTFTITNPGVFGGLFGTPIINQPQVAILAIGTIEKRPRVMQDPDGNDYLAIRTMAYFALSYDHRIVDGADAERFLSHVKQTLEAGQFSV
jgi:2-oxoglutarate dehydrogenase E2 component (dihydrolipoamide succinyltransferase)